MIKSPINIPMGSSGDCSIIHEDGVHKLVSRERGVWMTDYPIEVKQMWQAVEEVKASGRGLVGGLGLGVVAEFLTNKEEVKIIDIIERSKDVINLTSPYLSNKEKVNIIEADIYEYIKNLESWDYDFAILDTWQGESAETWIIQVMPLQRLIANKFGKQNVHCWVEDNMKVELLKILTEKEPYWILDKMPMPMSEEKALWFMENVGLPEWEKIYGEKI
jgi:hypothetical protein